MSRPYVRRFYYWETFVGAPVFLLVGGLIAKSALTSASARPVGIAVVALLLLLVAGTTRTNFVATVYPDGTMTFRSLTRVVSINLRDVTRIGVRSVGRSGAVFIFHTRDAKPALGGWNGRDLARYVVYYNPAVDYRPRYVR